MTTTTYPLRDSATMVRRQFRHTWRKPETIFGALLIPILMLLLFNYFFGGAMNVGTRYLDYMVPGIIMLAASYGVGVTAVGMATDVSEGVINRFRTMAISRASVPTGHVVGSLVDDARRHRRGARGDCRDGVPSECDPASSGWPRSA